ncbi:uridine diphosphate-N-acetylglucosamine-binding protein YvcK [Patescibacteria group bacterium]
MTNKQEKKIVVIGGGTGSSVLLSGLKQYPVDLTAIVPVTDDGGSTGRLRDEFGFLPVGDMRQCLAALASENGLLRQLLLYRFTKGKGLKGHNLGNLILTGLEDIVGSEPEAIIQAAKIFRLKGRVLPISKDLVKLVAEYSSGKKTVSEHKIEVYQLKKDEKISKLYTQPKANINPQAEEAIEQADLIVLAPGDLYNSIIANLVISGTKEAILKSKAKLIYAVNLMTLNSQTHQFSASDHVKELEKYLTKSLDYILLNQQPIPQDILKAYQKHDEYPVDDDLGNDQRVLRKNLIANSAFKKPKSDSLKRSLLRHDSEKLAKEIISLI